MIKNYFKIAWRNLVRNSTFSAINIIGLALGLTTCLLIILYVTDELSYDRYNKKADRIYRVNEGLKLGNTAVQYAVAMAPLAQTLKNDFPEVENAVRMKRASISIKRGNESIIENNAVFADPSVFDVFTLPLIYGSKAKALTQPNTIVISESAALKYFKQADAVGQSLVVPNFGTFKITGVIEDMPIQSHFKADFFMSMSTWPDSRSTGWLQSNYNTYVLLRGDAKPENLEKKFPEMLRKKSGDELKKGLGLDYDQFEKQGSFFRLNLMPLTKIHLHSNMTGEMGPNGTPQYVYIFSVVALFILIIACFNFMNLSTARSSNRAREVGVRKVLGSARKSIIAQFLTESILITFFATVVAVVTALLLLPAFNNISGKDIAIDSVLLIWVVPALFTAVLLVGFLAGAYPAFYLSAFKPVDVLKGKLAVGFKGSKLRSLLVTSQFAISIFLIIGTIVIYHQLKYIQNRDVGYNRNQVLTIQNAFALGNHVKAFKQELKQLPSVVNVTLSGFLPTSGNRGTDALYKDQSRDPKQTIFPQIWRIDEDYLKTLGMKLVSGRDFSSEMSTDSSAMIINETAAKFLGYSDPLDKTLYRSDEVLRPYKIIGIVKDFNFTSLRENITPVVMILEPDNSGLAVRIHGENIPTLLAQIEERWKKLAPESQLEYSFMDADFNTIYLTEQRMGKIFIIFAILAVIIACLGLFGLSAYAAEQRNKEISIRKVLGASVASVFALLSQDLMKLVAFSLLIAVPLAWWSMSRWLEDFAYRTEMDWWIYVSAGLLAFTVALVTISVQAIKAAVANPIKRLRLE